jgi:hypothetical protein
VVGDGQLGVVLVHGFKSGPETWGLLRERMEQDESLGFMRVLPFAYPTALASWKPLHKLPDLNTVADSLREYLRTEGGPFRDLVVVTHSMGGLVVQRYLARMLADGHGRKLARIRRVVMLSCPNDGSELLLSLRRDVFGRRGKNPQERELRPLNEQVAETRRVIVNQVLAATEVTDRTCPIPFSVYAGDRDGVVSVASARSVFADAAALPGDHFSILKATTADHRTFTTLRRHLLETADGTDRHTGAGTAAGPGRSAGSIPQPPAVANAVSGGSQQALAVQGGSVNLTAHQASPAPNAVVSPSAWPLQVGVIPPRAECFQDRAEVTRLRQMLAGGGAAVVAPAGQALPGGVLSGLGGVGKTQLAADYARTALTAGDVDVLVWITAGTRSAIVDSYAQVAAALLDVDADDPEEAAEVFLAWLEPKAGAARYRWLVVLDDVADPAVLAGLWPPPSPVGRMLATTRRREAALTGPGRRRIEVGVFTPAEAADYLTTALAVHDRTEPAAEVAGLAADMGCLPLALSQAAAYLVDAGKSCATYRTMLADRARTLAELLPELLPDGQNHTVAAAWSLSMEYADRLRPAGLARPMLQLAAFLDPNGIPTSVLTSPPALDYLTSTASVPPPVRVIPMGRAPLRWPRMTPTAPCGPCTASVSSTPRSPPATRTIPSGWYASTNSSSAPPARPSPPRSTTRPPAQLPTP